MGKYHIWNQNVSVVILSRVTLADLLRPLSAIDFHGCFTDLSEETHDVSSIQIILKMLKNYINICIIFKV